MKNNYKFIFFSIMCVIFTFIGCGKKALTDECGCYLNLDDACSNAEKKNQDILVLITSNGDDFVSEEFIEEVLKDETFKSTISKKYTVYHFDFSQKSYEKTVASPTASKAEQDLADSYADLMQTGYQFATLLDCQYTPAVFLLTKERYVIAEIEYENEIMDPEEFISLLQKYDDKSMELKEKVAATKKGTNLEKVEAIDKLYNDTSEKYRPMLIDLAKSIPELDKNNESGLCSKYLVLAAESKAIAAYTKGDLVGAVQSYISACDSSYINPDEKQECYYMAAYLLASTGSEDYDVIISYLNMALEASANSEKVPYILNAINYYQGQANLTAERKEETKDNR